MELAPIAGLADAIVDLVSTGATLKANNMVEIETVAPISSRLIVNQGAMKLKRTDLMPIITAMRETALKRQRSGGRKPRLNPENKYKINGSTQYDDSAFIH